MPISKFIAQFRTFLKKVWLEARRDEGVVGLVIAIALLAAASALIAATVRQNKDAEIRRMSSGATSVKLLKTIAISYYLTDPNPGDGIAAITGRLPCPDTNFPPDGLENGTTTCTATTGVVPWLTLGIGETDAVDGYGNYFTYVVPADNTARNVCTSIANAYDTTRTEYTGTLNDVTDTEVRLSTQTAGDGQSFYYAFISHGKNGLGAIAQGGAARQAPTSTAEIENCPSNNANCTDATPLAIISGPKDTTNATYFDDVVYQSSRAQLTALCESVTPAQKVNAFVSEDFGGVAIGSMPSSLTNVVSTASVQESTVTAGTPNADRVLRFTGTSAAVATATQIPSTERPTYISFEWKPTTVVSNEAGISIGFRATSADIDNGNEEDIFNNGTVDGLTLRFYEDNTNNANGSFANPIYLCDDVLTGCTGATSIASSGADTFTIAQNQIFRVEAYDDGTNIWARITQTTNPANTATLSFVAVDPALPYVQQDLDGNSSILIINHVTATTEVDDVLIARGGMGVDFDGADDIVETAGDSHDTTTGNLTLEGWFYPETLPSGSARATLISKWVHTAASSDGQAYRLYLTDSGRVAFEIAGDDAAAGTTIVTNAFAFGQRVTAAEWVGLAVSYDAALQTASLYVNGELSGTTSSTTFSTVGVNNGTAAFSIGAERDNTSAIVNELDGSITDIRVWNTVRTASEIFASYKRRAALTSGGATGLIVNWTLDRDTDRVFASTTATATAASNSGAIGTLTNNAVYVGIFQQFIPAFSTDFCAAATIINPYQCDYRTAAQSEEITIPTNMGLVAVKAWGAGGGGHDFGGATPPYAMSGGGGGFSAGQLRSINGVSIAGLNLRVDVGDGGAASGAVNNGAGGGGASGIWQDNLGTDRAGIIGGGGGGASTGDENLGSGLDCNATNDCGPGGGGGGPSNIASLTGVATTRARDDGDNECGGRGGDNTTFGADPPQATRCDAGGDDPTGINGASGGGSATGGGSLAGAGGAGYNGTDDGPAGTNDTTGAGGGGGGVRLSDMSAGGGEAGGYDVLSVDTDGDVPDDNGSGFGGGGGAGFADSAGALVPYGVAAGTAPAAGGTADADYGPSYCTAGGTPCITAPGRGGESGSATGKPGAVILKW